MHQAPIYQFYKKKCTNEFKYPDFGTSSSTIVRSARQKQKTPSGLNDITHQMDLIDIYQIYIHIKEYTFYSAAHKTSLK